MEYNPPYGSVDPDAPYVDRSTPNAIQGSKIPAKAAEHPQREIVAVIEAAGLTPDGDDTTQLLQALQFFFQQFPLYPECLNSNGKFDVSTPSAGTVRVPAGINWVIRGATRYSTMANVNLSTLASKTYHLRWDKTNLFRLRDLADVAYNPTSALENDPAFDSTYDDVLVARVATNGSNVATITNLINRNRLTDKIVWRGAVNEALDWTDISGTAIAYNWARSPLAEFDIALKGFRSLNTDADGTVNGGGVGKIVNLEVRIPLSGADRYGIGNIQYYYQDDANNNGWVSWVVRVMAL